MSVYDGPKITTNGLVLALDAGNRLSYVSGSTTWNDISNNANNGTLINGPTFNTEFNGSIVFDGVDDKVYMVKNNLSSGNQPFSVTAWINTSISTRELFFGLDNQSHLDLNAFNITGPTLSFHRLNSFVMYAPTGSLTIGTIQHVAWTYNGTTMDETNAKMYVNGNMKTGYQFSYNSGPFVYDFNSSEANFISNKDSYYSSAAQYAGNIYSVQLYNRALSPQEVLQNYNATKTRFGL